MNPVILDKLNNDGEYPIRILCGRESKDIIVANIRGINGNDVSETACEIASADIMATAVGVNALGMIAGPISEGLKKRWRIGNMKPLDIIICENLIDANQYLATLVKQNLDEKDKEKFDSLVGMVEASIGRMVPEMTAEMQEGNILRIHAEEYCELPVDKDGFRGDIPQIVNMQAVSPFTFYIQRKLFIHNMGHALIAYLGRLNDCSFIWEAVRNPHIRLLALAGMQDSAIALSREHGMSLDEILYHINDLIYRFGNKQLNDTVHRVGKDSKRKLSFNDRLVGAARLCVSQGICPVNICLGIAAAIKSELDQGAYTEKKETILENICGLHNSNTDMLWDMTIFLYDLLDSNTDLCNIVEVIDDIRKKGSTVIWHLSMESNYPKAN